jgi:hypothetical protein
MSSRTETGYTTTAPNSGAAASRTRLPASMAYRLRTAAGMTMLGLSGTWYCPEGDVRRTIAPSARVRSTMSPGFHPRAVRISWWVTRPEASARPIPYSIDVPRGSFCRVGRGGGPGGDTEAAAGRIRAATIRVAPACPNFAEGSVPYGDAALSAPVMRCSVALNPRAGESLPVNVSMAGAASMAMSLLSAPLGPGSAGFMTVAR